MQFDSKEISPCNGCEQSRLPECRETCQELDAYQTRHMKYRHTIMVDDGYDYWSVSKRDMEAVE